MPRRDCLISGKTYHIFTKSIARFNIFNNDTEYTRMLEVINYYKILDPGPCFSDFQKYADKDKLMEGKEQGVGIVAYCLMPTHLHLILNQYVDNGISVFMRKTLNSYSKYFNARIRRNGPLWQGRFKNVEIVTDEQLLHLTRYVHLNPVTAGIVKSPEFWKYSSYNEYLDSTKEKICNFSEILDINKKEYCDFVASQITYQKELSKIKHLIFE